MSSMKKVSQKEQEAQARARAELIIQVLSGQMKASEAARNLGVSRKTYYKWEKRFLSTMLNAVSEREVGRPSKEMDEEKEALKKQLEAVQKEVGLLKQAIKVRELLRPSGEKKRGRPKKRRRATCYAEAGGRRRKLRQAELGLEGETKDKNEGVSGYGAGDSKTVEGQSHAMFSGGGPGKPEESENRQSEPGGSGVVEDPEAPFVADPLPRDRGRKSWEKKSSEDQSG